MSYSSTFATKRSSVPLLVSDTLTSSSQSQNKKDRMHDSYYRGRTSYSAAQVVPSRNYAPPTTSTNGRSLPVNDYYDSSYSPSTAGYQATKVQGEDSDYCYESTPGRAWKKTEHAIPRVRVVGFNVNTVYTSESGASEAPSSRQLRQNPPDSTTASSGSSRTVSETSDTLRDQSLQLAAENPRFSHGTASSIPQRRTDTYKHSFAHGLDVRRKTNNQS